QMRDSGVRGILICADYTAATESRSAATADLTMYRLSDIESRFVCPGVRHAQRRRAAGLQLEQDARWALPTLSLMRRATYGLLVVRRRPRLFIRGAVLPGEPPTFAAVV